MVNDYEEVIYKGHESVYANALLGLIPMLGLPLNYIRRFLFTLE